MMGRLTWEQDKRIGMRKSNALEERLMSVEWMGRYHESAKRTTFAKIPIPGVPGIKWKSPAMLQFNAQPCSLYLALTLLLRNALSADGVHLVLNMTVVRITL